MVRDATTRPWRPIMSVELIRRTGDPTVADQWYLTATGWETTAAAGTAYSTKEAALVDAETQRELIGPEYRLVLKDTASGEEYVVPILTQ
jgi:hypothetical protein